MLLLRLVASLACLAARRNMPKIKTSRTKPPPEGYEDIAPVLEDYARKMRDAENEPHEGKRKVESTWNIVRFLRLPLPAGFLCLASSPSTLQPLLILLHSLTPSSPYAAFL